MKELLEIRKELKERKPEFIRQDTQKRKKLSLKWRRPKGIHSKMRHHFKGKRSSPSPGYKSPSKVRGLHASGLKIVRVYSLGDIEKIRKGIEGIVVSGQVGIKKAHVMLKRAKELGIDVLNLNIDERIKKIEDFIISKNKENKKETKAKPEPKKEGHGAREQGQKLTDAQETQGASEAQKSERLFREEKKEAEKKEKDKLLTRKA